MSSLSQEENPNPRKSSEFSQFSSSHANQEPQMAAVTATNLKDSIIAVASCISCQPLVCSEHLVWGVLTAVSANARKRAQGINLLLTTNEHCIGRVVEDVKFRLDSKAVSGLHCKIFKKKACNEDTESSSGAFLIDSSTNGTYLNWKRLKRGTPEVETKLHHGDIVSFAAPPEYEEAFAYVYREVQSSVSMADGTMLKRKIEELDTQNKRHKGIGIGAPEGPVSLVDFRSLQHSNRELRKQLEEHLHNIDALRNENREALERHENEMKELIDANKASAEVKNANEDLKEKLSAALQLLNEANEIIQSQKASMAKLQSQLDEERDQRREEREKAAADLKAAVEKVQSEAHEEVIRLSDAASKHEREQQELIHKLQESESVSSSLAESLRPKLEEARQKLVLSENKVCQLEAQLSEERMASDLRNKWINEVEIEISRMKREHDKEKVAWEEGWIKRLKSAKERIMLRETQLHSFYSTTEELRMLCTKQHERFKTIDRTLKDEADCDNVSHDLMTSETTGSWANSTGPSVWVK